MSPVHVGERYVYGIPRDHDKPVKLPLECEKAKVRFRNTDMATVVMKIGDCYVRRLLIDKGDHFEPTAFNMEQGRNRNL